MHTILLVDDMAIFREPIAVSLSSRGYAVVTAANGPEALAKMHSQQFDIVVLDVVMPGMNGIDVLRKMRNDYSLCELPVILLTARLDREMIVDAGRMGVRDCMLKGNFSLDELCERISRRLQPADKISATPKPVAISVAVHTKDSGPDVAAAPAASPVKATAPIQAQVVEATADKSASALDALKSIKPVLTRSQIEELVGQCEDLKAMSPMVGQLLKITGSKTCSIEQVAKLVRQDQGIALKVLKMANSVAYRRDEPVESVQVAIMRMGLSQIRQLVMNIAVVEQFGELSIGSQLDGRLFWEHSIATGLIAAGLTRAAEGNDQAVDAAFTAGLLHDVGRMVYVQCFGELYGRVLTTAAELRLPLEQVEQRMLMVSHTDLMDRLLHAWKFPKHLINPIALHHMSIANIRAMSTHTVNEVATLALANRLAHAMLLGSSGNETIYRTEPFVQALRLDTTALAAILDQAAQETQDIKYTLLNNSDRSPWPRISDRVRKELTAPLRPLFVSATPEINACHLMLQQISSTRDDELPNIAVVQIEAARERGMIASRLRQAEQASEVSELPILILSSNGNLTLDDATMTGRPVRPLTTTTSIARVIEAINDLMAVPGN